MIKTAIRRLPGTSRAVPTTLAGQPELASESGA
jgi:hypothetical protein